jgi:L-lactate dehydrogenase
MFYGHERNARPWTWFGIVAGRVAEAVLRDEQAVFPVGSFNPRFGVMLSLPSVVGSAGASEVLWPEMSEDETQALEHGADALRQAVSKILS